MVSRRRNEEEKRRYVDVVFEGMLWICEQLDNFVNIEL